MKQDYLDINDEYMAKIIRQFEEAKGESVKNIHLEVYLATLKEFIKERQRIKNTYRFFLSSLSLDFNDEDTVEIGKGRYDTLVTDFDKTSMITPYIRGLENKNRIIIPSTFKVLQNGIILSDSPYTFKTYMTQNPYSIEDIENFEKIDGNLIFGIYGNIYDKDRKYKIQTLYNLNKRLDNNFMIDGGTFDDDYYYILTTNKTLNRR